MRTHRLLIIALAVIVLALIVLSLDAYLGGRSEIIWGLILFRSVLMSLYFLALSWAARQVAVRPMLFGVVLAVGALLLLEIFSFPGASTTVLILASAGVLTFLLSRYVFVGNYSRR